MLHVKKKKKKEIMRFNITSRALKKYKKKKKRKGKNTHHAGVKINVLFQHASIFPLYHCLSPLPADTQTQTRGNEIMV